MELKCNKLEWLCFGSVWSHSHCLDREAGRALWLLRDHKAQPHQHDFIVFQYSGPLFSTIIFSQWEFSKGMASSSILMPSSIEEGKPPVTIIINVPLIIAWSFKYIYKYSCFVIEEKKISIATVAQAEHEMTGWLQSLNPIKFAHELCFPLLHYSFTLLFLSCPFNISGSFLCAASHVHTCSVASVVSDSLWPHGQ